MKERPILMNGAMVRAVLNGAKTQTRRLVKPNPKNGWEFETPPVLGRITSPHPKKNKFGAFIRRGVGTDFPETDIITCPFGQPGDRLWVRETCRAEELESGLDGVRYMADDVFRPIENSRETSEAWLKLRHYGKKPVVPGSNDWRKVPSIHMPRWASRILLEITDVRVEKLNSISTSDCYAEGIGIPEFPDLRNPAYSQFLELWEAINGAESWGVNPWVWVIEFKVVQP